MEFGEEDKQRINKQSVIINNKARDQIRDQIH